MSDCNLLLCDEPTGALDSKTGMEIMDIICGESLRGKTIVIATHDVNVAARCSKQIKMEDGKIHNLCGDEAYEKQGI